MTDRQLILLGAVNLVLAISAGAFGAHGLKYIYGPELLAIWHTAVLYHLIHALALFIVALLYPRFKSARLPLAGLLMCVGIVLFSGSLYLLVLTGATWLGAVVPVGGIVFIFAWCMVAWVAWQASAHSTKR